MSEDKRLAEIESIPRSIVTKLDALAIHTIRQLSERLKGEESELQSYLDLSDDEFASFRRKAEGLIKEEFPEDTLPQIHPRVHKRGVAVHRIHDPSRPKYYDQDDE